jgi:hypothetical protein
MLLRAVPLWTAAATICGGSGPLKCLPGRMLALVRPSLTLPVTFAAHGEFDDGRDVRLSLRLWDPTCVLITEQDRRRVHGRHRYGHVCSLIPTLC